MLPVSYDEVSEETKKAVQLFMAHARGFLQGSGSSDEDARTILENHEAEATWNAIKKADEDWKESRRPSSAEQFVQWFAKLVWEGLTDGDDRPFPYDFTSPVVGGPLSTEFLEVIGKTEAEVLGMAKKEESPEEGVKLALHTIPAFVKTETSPPGTPNAPAVPSPLAQLAQLVKAEPQSPENTSILGKRKNSEPDATARKQERENDEQRVPAGSRDTNRTYKQWGAPLAAKDEQLMDVSLMNKIWYSRVSERLRHDHGPECFRVKIPKEKAWSLLGQDIARVFVFIRTDWRPIRLYTYESDCFLHVGLLVWKSQAKGKNIDVVCHKLPTLFRLLSWWSRIVRDIEKPDCLADFLARHQHPEA